MALVYPEQWTVNRGYGILRTMPLLKSAIKKQRVDRRRAASNVPVSGRVKSTLKAARTAPSSAAVSAFYAAVDHAVKKHLVSARAAARMKSRLLKGARAKLTTSPFAK